MFFLWFSKQNIRHIIFIFLLIFKNKNQFLKILTKQPELLILFSYSLLQKK